MATAANLSPSATSRKIALGKCYFNWDHEIINDGQAGGLGGGASVWKIRIQCLSLWGVGEEQLCTGIIKDNFCLMKEKGGIFLCPTRLT